ncbi:Isoprenoid synthase domain containing protein [Rhypophila decipiens]
MDTNKPQKVKVPDFLASWPWKRVLNPHYETVKAETDAWIESFDLFKDAKSQDAFERCQAPRLAALAYPHMSEDQLRVGSDFMALLYAYDEYTDVSGEVQARRLANIVVHAMNHPSSARPSGENPLGEIARQFWTRALTILSPSAQRHFLDTFAEYVNSVIQQRHDNAQSRLRTFDEYWALRHHNCACLPSFALGELGLDIPDDIYSQPPLERMRALAVQLICASNDVYSYNVEVLRGMGLFNVVSVVMVEQSMTSTKDAVAWIGRRNDQLVAEFLAAREELSRLGKSERWSEQTVGQVETCVDILGCWVSANEDWHFESQKHFGTEGAKVQMEREVVMLPGPGIHHSLQAEVGSESDGVLPDETSENAGGMVRRMMEQADVAGMQILTKGY